MMRFTKVNDDIQTALVQFCVEQETMSEYMPENEIESVVESAFSVMNRIHETGLRTAPIYRYHLYAGDAFTDEIFPNSIKENGVLYNSVIHLGTFLIDSYCASSDETKLITCGYDVIYDFDSSEIKLIYCISITDDSMTTTYRVDTELYEDFNFYEFIIDLTSQMVSKLKCNQGRFEGVGEKEAA